MEVVQLQFIVLLTKHIDLYVMCWCFAYETFTMRGKWN